MGAALEVGARRGARAAEVCAFVIAGFGLAACAAACDARHTLEPQDGSSGSDDATTDASSDASSDATTDAGATTDSGRRDNSCVGPAASTPWPTTVSIEHADCATRPRAACDALGGAGGSAGGMLDAQLLRLAQTQCFLPELTFVMVQFESGCPSSLSVKDTAGHTDASLSACLAQQLATVRWTCAETADCSLIEFDTVP